MTNTRPAPMSIRFTEDHNELIAAALKKAGLKKTIGWFPKLLMILLSNYVGAK